MTKRKLTIALLAGSSLLLGGGLMAMLPSQAEKGRLADAGMALAESGNKLKMEAQLPGLQSGKSLRGPLRAPSFASQEDLKEVDVSDNMYDAYIYGFNFACENSLKEQFTLSVNGDYNDMPYFLIGAYEYYNGRPMAFQFTAETNENTVIYPYLCFFKDGIIKLISGSYLSLAPGTPGEFTLEISDAFSSNVELESGNELFVAFLMQGCTGNEEVTISNLCWTRYDVKGLEAVAPDDEQVPEAFGDYDLRCAVNYNDAWFGIGWDNNIEVMKTDAEEVVTPILVSYDGNDIEINTFGNWGQEDFSWSLCPNLHSLTLAGDMEWVFCKFEKSTLTHLYIDRTIGRCNFAYAPQSESGAPLYIHVPLSYVRDYRNDYTSTGHNEFLAADEMPGMPAPRSGDTQYRQYLADGVTCVGVGMVDDRFTVTEIATDAESVTLPNLLNFGSLIYQVTRLGSASWWSDDVLLEGAPNLKSLSFGESMAEIRIKDYKSLSEMHFAGPTPSFDCYELPSEITIYVSNKDYYYDYANNWSNNTVLPDGWEFEYLVVDVKRPGEFAQTYLELTDSDWSAEGYIKVTGELNSLDLSNMKNLSALINLDLSEAEFYLLPDYWLQSSKVYKVTLPESVTYIPSYAFYNCTSLSELDAPGVEYVDKYAFSYCQKLSTLNIKPLRSVGYYGFRQTKKLSSLEVADDCEYIGTYAFDNSGLTSFSWPSSLDAIPDNCFYSCRSLEEVTLPETLVQIGARAFGNCESLTQISLPTNLKKLSDSVFYNCKALTAVELPAMLTEIGYDCFGYCESLTEFKCRAVIPPYASSSFTDGMNLTNCSLYVPPMSVDTYRDTENWRNFYKMYPLMEPVEYICVSYPIAVNISEEDNVVLQGNPNIDLTYNDSKGTIGQFTVSGDGTMSAGMINYEGLVYTRYRYNYQNDRLPSLINYADKMRTDALSVTLSFYSDQWHFFTLPFDCEVKDIVPGDNVLWVIRKYNGEKRAGGDLTNTWENLTEDDVLEAGKGYIIRTAQADYTNSYYLPITFPSRNTVTKNNIFRSTSVIVDLEEHTSEFVQNRSWNLVGNPYPAYYYVNMLQSKNEEEFTTPLTIWRDGSYQAYSPVDDNLILRPFEAFFIQRPIDFNEMVFAADGRMHYDEAKSLSQNDEFSPGIMRPASPSRDVFNFNLLNGQRDNRARVVFNEEASAAYEIERDAAKMMDADQDAALIWVDADQAYEICERPFADGVATLSVKAVSGTELSISLSGSHKAGYGVKLTDKLTGMTVDLTATDYAFTASDNDEGRFEVRFMMPESTGLDAVEAEFGADADVTVCDLNGVVVYRGALSGFVPASEEICLVSNGKRTVKALLK